MQHGVICWSQEVQPSHTDNQIGYQLSAISTLSVLDQQTFSDKDEHNLKKTCLSQQCCMFTSKIPVLVTKLSIKRGLYYHIRSVMFIGLVIIIIGISAKKSYWCTSIEQVWTLCRPYLWLLSDSLFVKLYITHGIYFLISLLHSWLETVYTSTQQSP